jgi:hypothetical protein
VENYFARPCNIKGSRRNSFTHRNTILPQGERRPCTKKLRLPIFRHLIIARFGKMGEIAKRIELYNLAHRLASKYITEEHKFRRPDIPRLLHDSIRSQMRDGANEAVFIASKALEDIELK